MTYAWKNVHRGSFRFGSCLGSPGTPPPGRAIRETLPSKPPGPMLESTNSLLDAHENHTA
jgi:hypothetical protein